MLRFLTDCVRFHEIILALLSPFPRWNHCFLGISEIWQYHTLLRYVKILCCLLGSVEHDVTSRPKRRCVMSGRINQIKPSIQNHASGTLAHAAQDHHMINRIKLAVLSQSISQVDTHGHIELLYLQKVPFFFQRWNLERKVPQSRACGRRSLSSIAFWINFKHCAWFSCLMVHMSGCGYTSDSVLAECAAQTCPNLPKVAPNAQSTELETWFKVPKPHHKCTQNISKPSITS